MKCRPNFCSSLINLTSVTNIEFSYKKKLANNFIVQLNLAYHTICIVIMYCLVLYIKLKLEGMNLNNWLEDLSIIRLFVIPVHKWFEVSNFLCWQIVSSSEEGGTCFYFFEPDDLLSHEWHLYCAIGKMQILIIVFHSLHFITLLKYPLI